MSDSPPVANPEDDGRGERSERRSSSGAVEPKTIRRAIREIRREGYKAAFITAAVEAALVFALANLALSTVQIPALSGKVFLPTAVIAALQSVVGTIAPTTLPRSTLVAVALGTAVAAITFSLRVRRPAIERFERANPPVAEALRTARDTVQDDIDTPIARVLYADVVTRLRTTSSIGLLPLRRITLMVVVVLIASLLSVQAAVVGVQLTPLDGAGAADGPDDALGTPAGAGEQTPEYEGLQSGDDVLGDPEDVEAGSENLSAVLESQAGPGESEEERSYERSGLPPSSGSAVEARQAGFDAPEELDDADLIREYNLQIREAAEEEG